MHVVKPVVSINIGDSKLPRFYQTGREQASLRKEKLSINKRELSSITEAWKVIYGAAYSLT
jgi:hypothetical protein